MGIGLEVPFANTNIWSFQTGLNFISKGVKGDGVTDAWDVVDVTINQLYLELPLMVGAFRQKLRRSCIMNMRLKCLLSITTAT